MQSGIISRIIPYLKGQCQEIFCMRFVASKFVPQPPDSYPKAVLNINSNSPRYSNSKLIPVVPPPLAGSNPTVWPLLGDRILRCGPPPIIGDRGSDFLLWPLPGDRTFRCSPSRGIRLSAMAPSGDRTFRYSPSRGIGLSVLATPGGSRATPQDCSNILPEHAVTFKGTTCEKRVDGGTILPKAYI